MNYRPSINLFQEANDVPELTAEPELAPSSPARLTPEDDVVPLGKERERNQELCSKLLSHDHLVRKGHAYLMIQVYSRTPCHFNDKKNNDNNNCCNAYEF